MVRRRLRGRRYPLPMTKDRDWTRIAGELDEQGWAVLPGLMTDAACEAMAALYDQDAMFRGRIVMARRLGGANTARMHHGNVARPHMMSRRRVCAALLAAAATPDTTGLRPGDRWRAPRRTRPQPASCHPGPARR